jgi:hypothetical protein
MGGALRQGTEDLLTRRPELVPQSSMGSQPAIPALCIRPVPIDIPRSADPVARSFQKRNSC